MSIYNELPEPHDLPLKVKKELTVYLLASGASDKSAEVQCAVILHSAGPDFIQKEEQFQYANADDRKKPVNLLEKLEEYCNKNLNQFVEAFRFWNTKLCEPFDAFLSELTNQAAACGFGLQKERMICDKIVFSVEQHLQQVLLLEPNLTLAKTIDICRTYEISVKNALDLQQASGQHQVHALSDQTRKHGRNFSTSTAQPECQFCGKYHQKGKTFCPAYGRFCANCKGRNHFQAKCKKPAMHQLTTAPTEPSNCTADNVYLHNVGRDHERQRTARMKEVPH